MTMENSDSTSLLNSQKNGTLKSYDDDHDQTSTGSYQKQIFSFDETHWNSNVSNDLRGRLLLLVVAFLYGSLNVSLRLVYALRGPPSASALSSSRGWLAALCFIPLLARHSPRQFQGTGTQHKSLWTVAFELAFFNLGAQGLLTLGLLTTESARASFLTQTSVVMTPVISAFAGHTVHCRVWIGCLVALVGLLLLSEEKGFTLSFAVGDLFCLAAALFWSCYLFRLSAVGGAFDEIQLQAAKTFILACMYSVWFLSASFQSDAGMWLGWANPVAWALIFYSALGPGTLADIIQQKGQSTVSAAESNVILSLEPVFTAILGLLLLGEATTWQELVGGGLIIVASLVSTDHG